MSDELERPGYNKSPLDALIRIRELVDLEERHIKIAVPTSSEAVNRNLFHPFNGNEFLNHMLKVGRFNRLMSFIPFDPYAGRRPPILELGAGPEFHIVCGEDRQISRKTIIGCGSG